MTWTTLELGHTSAPHSRADAERPERHSHAERRNDQRDLEHADHAHAPKSCCNYGLLWEAPPRLRRSAVAQQTPDRGRRLAGDERLRDFPDTPRRLHRRQAASHGYVFSQILSFWPRFACLPDCAYHDDRGLKRSGRRLLLRTQHNRQVPKIIHLNAEALS